MVMNTRKTKLGEDAFKLATNFHTWQTLLQMRMISIKKLNPKLKQDNEVTMSYSLS